MLVSVGSSRPSFFVLGGEKPTSNTAHRHTVDAGKKHRAARFLPNQYVESRPDPWVLVWKPGARPRFQKSSLFSIIAAFRRNSQESPIHDHYLDKRPAYEHDP